MSLTDGLVAYWKLNESSGTRAPEFGPFQLSPHPGFGTVGSVAGINDQAAAFDVNNATHLRALATSDTDALAGGRVAAWSLAFWFNWQNHNPGNGSGVFQLVSKYSGSSNDYGIVFEYTPTTSLLTALVTDAGTPYLAQLDNIAESTAHLLVVTFDYGHGIGISLDGGPMNFTASNLASVATVAPLTIGGNGALVLTCWIDEFGKWDRPLAAPDIAQLWNNGNGTTLTDTGLEAQQLAGATLAAGTIQTTGLRSAQVAASALTAAEATYLQARQLAAAVFAGGPQPVGLHARQLAASVLTAATPPTGLHARQLAASVLTAATPPTGLYARQLAASILTAATPPTGLQVSELAAAVLGASWPQTLGLRVRQLRASVLALRKPSAPWRTLTPGSMAVASTLTSASITLTSTTGR